MQGAAQMAAKLRAMKAYTNTATFDLKCEVRDGLTVPSFSYLTAAIIAFLDHDPCLELRQLTVSVFITQRCGKGLKGEKEARQHAAETGHAEFGEY